MSLDADIVRCAAPWPGTAASLLEGLAALGSGRWHLEEICASAAAGIEPGIAAQILAGLAVAGLGILDDDDCWVSNYTAQELIRLAQILKGAEHFRRLSRGGSTIELAVTMPLSPCYLERELAALGGRRGGFLDTSSAFLRIAQSADQRLVVMVPFIDQSGFNWVRRIFGAAREEVEKILILRDVEKYAADISVHHQDWLNVSNIRIEDYHLAHDSRIGRRLENETFHAKLVLADECLAYVGSANLLWASESASLEAGVVIDGEAAGQVSRLVDGVLRAIRNRLGDQHTVN